MRLLGLVAVCVFVLVADSAAAKKDKNKVKHKSFHPVDAANAADYTGSYMAIDSLYSIDVWAGADGELTVTVHDGTTSTVLSDVRRTGARLQGVLPEEGGRSKSFDATFVVRDLNGVRLFGLLVEEPRRVSDDLSLARIFCARR